MREQTRDFGLRINRAGVPKTVVLIRSEFRRHTHIYNRWRNEPPPEREREREI